MNERSASASPLPAEAADGFDLDWLSLREPFDAEARDRERDRWGLPLLQAWAAQRVALQRGPLRVLDLGSGSGANLRYLAPWLGGAQRWCLVDHDPRLLAAQAGAIARWAAQHGLGWTTAAASGLAAPGDRHDAPQPVGMLAGEGWQAEVVQRRLDLAQASDALAAAAGQVGVDLLTASALLDLLSARAIEALIDLGVRCDAAMLWALNVDGRRDWHPAEAGDALLAALFARHQQRDKGFGPALGPAAASCAAQLLRARAWAVHEGRSDWWLDAAAGSAHRQLLAALVEGDAAAAQAQLGVQSKLQSMAQSKGAAETGPLSRPRSKGQVDPTGPAGRLAVDSDAGARVQAWSLRRAAALSAQSRAPMVNRPPERHASQSGGGLQACIGHVEVLALPPGPAPGA